MEPARGSAPLLENPAPPLELPPAGPAPEFELEVRGTPRLEALGAGGQWLAHCEGDGPTPSLWLSMPGALRQPIDALLASSARGRFLVVRRGEVPWLVDAHSGLWVALGPLAADLDADALADHRSFAFSEDERELALLAPSAQSARLLDLVRVEATPAADLAALSREVTWAGAAWRIEYQGPWLVVRLAQTPRSRHRAWPVPQGTSAPRRCQGRAHFDAFTTLSQPNAAFEVPVRLLAPGGERAEEAPGFLHTLGGGWVRREDDGRLVLVQGRVQKQLASAACGARILHADPRRRLFVVACEQYRPTPLDVKPETKTSKTKSKARPQPTRFPLYVVGPGSVVALGADTARTGVDRVPDAESPRFVPLRPGSETALLDLETRRLVTLGADVLVVASSGERALIKRGQKLSTYSTAGEKPLALAWAPFEPLWLGRHTLLRGQSYGPIEAPSCLLPNGLAPFAFSLGGAVATFELLAEKGRGRLRVLAPCAVPGAVATENSQGAGVKPSTSAFHSN